MELTSAQKHNLVQALRGFESAKKQLEQASRNVQTKLDKLKETCQGSGSEQQVLAKAHEELAKAYMSLPEDQGMEP